MKTNPKLSALSVMIKDSMPAKASASTDTGDSTDATDSTDSGSCVKCKCGANLNCATCNKSVCDCTC